MEQNAPKLKIVIDLDAAKKMYTRLIDVHRFGKWRLFFDEEVPADAEFTYDLENTPPWIIHKEDIEAINALYRRLAKDITAAKIPDKKPDESEGILVFAGGCIISKVIILIHSLLLSLLRSDVTTFQRIVLTLHMCDMIEEETLSRRKTVFTLKTAA